MTDENAELPEIETPVAEEVIAPLSIDEMRAMAKPADPEKIKEHPDEEETLEGGDVDEEGEPEEKEAAKLDEAPKEKKSWGQREREAKLVERERAVKLESENNEARAELKKAKEDNQKLVDFIQETIGDAAPKKDVEVDEDDDEGIIIPKASAEIKELKAQITQSQFVNVLEKANELGNKHVADFGVLHSGVIAGYAQMALVKAKATNMPLTNEVALQAANTHVMNQLFDLHKSGASPSQIAQYIVDEAAAFKVDVESFKKSQGKTNDNTKSRVNMKAVEDARVRAGAPAIEKESVRVSNGLDWKEEAVAAAKEKGHSTAYLRKMGLVA